MAMTAMLRLASCQFSRLRFPFGRPIAQSACRFRGQPDAMKRILVK